MKHFVKKMMLLVALCATTIVVSYAQEPSKVEGKFKELVQRYDNIKGVECITVAKGSGLEMFKMMFNKQFSKDFMKGVKSITMINYTEASPESCQALRQDIDSFSSLLTEFDMNKDKEAGESGYMRGFASTPNENTISDFVIAMENDGLKMIMYMAGDIKVEQPQK
jgi:hypothetical protein